MKTVYDFTAKDRKGNDVSLSAYAGKVLLIVNTATGCGLDVAQAQGRYADGVYTGSGTGFRGEISSKVTVQNGKITDITILSYRDDSDYFGRAQSGVIGAILSSQTLSARSSTCRRTKAS